VTGKGKRLLLLNFVVRARASCQQSRPSKRVILGILVCLVYLVCLVCLVDLVYFVVWSVSWIGGRDCSASFLPLGETFESAGGGQGSYSPHLGAFDAFNDTPLLAAR